MLITMAVLGAAELQADDPGREIGSKTVVGPSNIHLANGATALMRGDVEEGIRLTRLGLDDAVGNRERVAGLSNLCAGYLRLQQLEVALEYCNAAISINARSWRALSNRALVNIMLENYDAAGSDLDLAEEIAPNASALKKARRVWLDATDPVAPNIIIDDRRVDDQEG